MKKTGILFCTLAAFLVVTGCSILKGNKKEILNPLKPINVTVWHYYNGNVKDKFDALVEKFNETMGMEKGVVIDAKSHGDVQQLADAVYDAANKTIGSQPIPDVFAAYPDNAYRVNQVAELVDLENYFSETELSAFRKEFLEEGRFGENQKLKIIPIAKSTENMYLNKTDWEVFANTTGAKLQDLNTWEGVVRTAQKYKDYSGKALLSIDANANYMLVSSMQLGNEMYMYNGNKLEAEHSTLYIRDYDPLFNDISNKDYI